MIIYNKAWLNNLYLHNKVTHEHAAGNITTDEVKAVKAAYPVGFYTPGIIARMGIFILTCIIVLFSAGLLSLIFESARIIETFGWWLFLGLVSGVVLETMIRTKHHYRSGADDALLWITAAFLTTSFVLLLDWLTDGYKINYLAISIFIFALSSLLMLRFLDAVMGTVACLSFFALVFFSVQKIGPVGEAIMPFVIILASALVYVFSLKLSHKLTVPYYANCLTFIQITSLVILYAAGNYFVVDSLNNILKDLPGTSGNLQFGFFFWGWTILLPIAYIVRGLLKKDVVLLRVGLLIIGAAVYTFRTYYHVLSIELALIIGGFILLTIAYAAIKYLKTPKHGFTYDDADQSDPLDNIRIESLITAGTLGHTAAPAQPTNRFGGGDFGGGGSGGGF